MPPPGRAPRLWAALLAALCSRPCGAASGGQWEWPEVPKHPLGADEPLYASALSHLHSELPRLDPDWQGMRVARVAESWITDALFDTTDVHIIVELSPPEGRTFDPTAPATVNDTASKHFVSVFYALAAGGSRTPEAQAAFLAGPDGAPQGLALDEFPFLRQPEWEWDCDDFGCA
eukprot:TRINITY_DN51834_c0_g1_i1.p2 TRINITY_DN51834_c0_g1~~TRINITY_DN51834_c0_g1_i1.p2  ORF type:complete len:200 (+),score=55.00 TRINITY_DN51834_c0_g1_i1:76-600(+)